jgi:hypothetical protein
MESGWSVAIWNTPEKPHFAAIPKLVIFDCSSFDSLAIGWAGAVLSAESPDSSGALKIHNCEETEWVWSASLSFSPAKTSKWES